MRVIITCSRSGNSGRFSVTGGSGPNTALLRERSWWGSATPSGSPPVAIAWTSRPNMH